MRFQLFLLAFVALTLLPSIPHADAIRGQTFRDRYTQPAPKDFIAVRNSNDTYDYMDYALAITYKATIPWVIASFAVLTVPVLLVITSVLACCPCGKGTICKRVEPKATPGTKSWTAFWGILVLMILVGSAMQMAYHAALYDNLLGTKKSSVLEKGFTVLDEVTEMLKEVRDPIKETHDALPGVAEKVAASEEDANDLLALVSNDLAFFAEFDAYFPTTWGGAACAQCTYLQTLVPTLGYDLEEAMPYAELADLYSTAHGVFVDSGDSIYTSTGDVLDSLADVNKTIVDTRADIDDVVSDVRHYKNTYLLPGVMSFLSLGLLVGLLYGSTNFTTSKAPTHCSRYTSFVVLFGAWVVLLISVMAVVVMVDGCRLLEYEEAKITALDRTDDIAKVLRACKENLPISETFNITGELTLVDQIGQPHFTDAPNFEIMSDALSIPFTNATIGFAAGPYNASVAAQVDSRNAYRLQALTQLEILHDHFQSLKENATFVNGTVNDFRAFVDKVLDTRCLEVYEALVVVKDGVCSGSIQDILDIAVTTLWSVIFLLVAFVGSYWVYQGLLHDAICVRHPHPSSIPFVRRPGGIEGGVRGHVRGPPYARLGGGTSHPSSPSVLELPALRE